MWHTFILGNNLGYKMKVIKYLIMIGIALALWITAPIWMPDTTYHGSSEVSQTDTEVSQQKKERNALLKEQDRKLAELEAKFGTKDSVLPSLKSYWATNFSDADAFELLRCEKLTAGYDGWIAVCQFRLQGKIKQDTYTINHGKVSR